MKIMMTDVFKIHLGFDSMWSMKSFMFSKAKYLCREEGLCFITNFSLGYV